MTQVHTAPPPKPKKVAACKRTAARETQEERKFRLVRRRLIQRSGETGLIPMRNRRVQGAIEGQALLITAEYVEKGLTIDQFEIQKEAIRRVAMNLPKPRGQRCRVRPSKSDDPVYRKVPSALAALDQEAA